MSILSTLASDIGSVLDDPGKLVTDVVDGVLPQKLKSIGDLAGGLVDAVIGKEARAVSHFQDGVKDLPQLIGTAPPLDDLTAGATGTEAAFPEPPAPATDAANAASDTSLAATGAPNDVQALLALPSDQFMKAVSSGAVPPDVADDPAAMLQIQARMNDIAQMNQLVTSMMTAMHQMQMSIAQNIRA
jgi:hypothetical protein